MTHVQIQPGTLFLVIACRYPSSQPTCTLHDHLSFQCINCLCSHLKASGMRQGGFPSAVSNLKDAHCQQIHCGSSSIQASTSSRLLKNKQRKSLLLKASYWVVMSHYFASYFFYFFQFILCKSIGALECDALEMAQSFMKIIKIENESIFFFSL